MPGFFRRVLNAVRGTPAPSGEARLRERVQELMLEHRRMLAKVDAADSGEFDRRLWERADALGPNAAFSEQVRGLLRNRGRHEAINNNYARGLVRTHAYDLIGTCPRLQLTIPGDEDGSKAKAIEQSFGRWAKAAQLGPKFRLMEKANGRDGEAFAILGTAPRLPHPVKLNVRVLEAEMCQSPWGQPVDPLLRDGIRVDESGEPVEYYFLRRHPGESFGTGFTVGQPFVTVPAGRVLHWFEKDRAGQARGIPRITAALPLFAQQRRFTLAVITAAEFAAMIAGVMKTSAAVNGGEAVQVDQWQMFELIRGALLTLPAGWEASQMQSQQPATGYGEFKREILNEVGRGSGAPLNTVSGNSSGYNYSSARCDFVPYAREKRVDRYDFQLVVVDPVFVAWVEEARLTGDVPEGVAPIEEWAWTWNYDGFGGIDEVKDATADDIRLKNGTATLKEILAEYGQDVYEHIDQLAKERDYALSKGLPWPLLFTAPAASAPPADPGDGSAAVSEATLRASLAECGVAESVAELVAESIFPTGGRPRLPKPSRNGVHEGVAR